MRLIKYIQENTEDPKEIQAALKKDKELAKKWQTFEKAAQKEIGKKFTGTVTGDMLFDGGLSKNTVKLYWDYFHEIEKARKRAYKEIPGSVK